MIASGAPHATKREDTYMGYRIPAGSIVTGNHFAITREESVFGKNADEFIPERWLVKSDEHGEKTDGVQEDSLSGAALKDLPQTGFGFGRRGCTGRIIAGNTLFILLARMLWAFNLEAAVSDAGEKLVIDDMDCSDGFAAEPRPFRARLQPRGQWVRDIIHDAGDTRDVDHSEMLEKIGRERTVRLNKVDN